MAIHVNKKNKKISVKWATIDKSELIYNRHLKQGVKSGLLSVGSHKDVTKKQYDFIQKHELPIVATMGRDVALAMDSNGRVGKAEFYLTSGMAQSPLMQVSKASQRERMLNFIIDTSLKIAEFRHFEKIHAYFLTLTIPNVDLDGLSAGIKSVSKIGSEVLKALKDGQKRGNGLRLPSIGGDYVKVLGSLLKTEITVNKNKLKFRDVKGIFHPHVHVLFYTDEPLSLHKSSSILFNYWAKKHPADKLSRDAFKLEQCYDRNNKSVDIRKAVAESSKYAIKPNFYARFPKIPTEFSTRVFCALFKATKGKQMLRPSGFIRDAKSYMNFLKSSKVLPAVVAGGYSVNVSDLHVPDIYSHVALLHNGKIISKTEMSAKEVLWANRSLIKSAIWNAPDVDWPVSEKGQLYKYLYKNTKFLQSTDDFKKRINNWYLVRENELNNELDKENVDGEKCTRINDQLNDLDILNNALPDLYWNKIQAVNMKQKYIKRALFIQMQKLNVKFTTKNNLLCPIFDADMKKSKEIEKQLAMVYLSDDVTEVHFITGDLCNEYLYWTKTGDLTVSDVDEVEYSAICKVTKNQFQKSVNQLASSNDLLADWKHMFA